MRPGSSTFIQQFIQNTLFSLYSERMFNRSAGATQPVQDKGSDWIVDEMHKSRRILIFRKPRLVPESSEGKNQNATCWPFDRWKPVRMERASLLLKLFFGSFFCFQDKRKNIFKQGREKMRAWKCFTKINIHALYFSLHLSAQPPNRWTP